MTFKPMTKRLVEKALRRQHCVKVPGRGKHEKWRCESGEHTTLVPHGGEMSPKVVGNIIGDMKCLPEGWLR